MDGQDGETALIRAAKAGDAEGVEGLLAGGNANPGGVDVNGVDGKCGGTPLRWAAFKGHAAVVRVLLGAAEIDVNAVDKFGVTPLGFAAVNGHVEVVKLLLGVPGIEVNRADDGRTPLYEASLKGHVEVVVALLAADDIDVNRADEHGKRTPLHWAAHHGRREIVRALLTVPGIRINQVDKEVKTPLWIASKEGHAEVVKALVAAGADVHRRSKDGVSPFEAACSSKKRKRGNRRPADDAAACARALRTSIGPTLLTLMRGGLTSSMAVDLVLRSLDDGGSALTRVILLRAGAAPPPRTP